MGLLDEIAAGGKKKKKKRKGKKKASGALAGLFAGKASPPPSPHGGGGGGGGGHNAAGDAGELKDKGLPMDVIEDLQDVFGFFSHGGKNISRSQMQAVYRQFGQEYSDADMAYVMKCFTNGKSHSDMDFTQFGETLYNNMGRKDAFGDLWDLIHTSPAKALSRDELQKLMTIVGEQMTEDEAERILAQCTSRDKFVEFWGKNLVELVAPPPPPALPGHGKSRGGGGGGGHRAAAAASDGGGAGGGGGGAPAPAPAPGGPPASKDPRYKKYFMLVKMHMPMEQIKMKMAATSPNLDPNVLDHPDDPAPP
jgi:Ca2+-binding EF-hand superfamily protein